MTTAFQQPGMAMTLTAPEALSQNEFTLVGNIGVVAADTAESGATFVGYTMGVFELTKETSLAISAGDKLYWDTSSKKVDKTASNARLVGIAVEDAGASATAVKAFIHPALSASREGAQGGAVADLDQDISASYVEAEVQAISDKVDALLAELRTAGVIAAS